MLTKEQDQQIAANILQSVAVWVSPQKRVNGSFGIALGHKVVETIVNLNSLLPDYDDVDDRIAALKLWAAECGWSTVSQNEFYYDSSCDFVATLHDECESATFAIVDNDAIVDVRKLASISMLVAIVFDPNKFSVTDATKCRLAQLMAKQLVCRKTVASIPAEYFVPDSPGDVTTQLVWADISAGRGIDPETQKSVPTAASYTGQIKLLGYAPGKIPPPDTGIPFGIPLRSNLLRQPASQLA